MNEGTLTVIISAGVALLVGLVTNFVARRSNSETNETKKLELLINGQGDRITSLESEVRELKAEKEKQGRELAQIKDIVRRWIVKIEARWYSMTTEPMPSPSTDELALLDITLPLHVGR